MTRAYLSLGSNLEPQAHLRAALVELRQRFGEIVVSPAYRFAAVGFAGPDFLNLAVGIETDLDASSLNDWLHALEAVKAGAATCRAFPAARSISTLCCSAIR